MTRRIVLHKQYCVTSSYILVLEVLDVYVPVKSRDPMVSENTGELYMTLDLSSAWYFDSSPTCSSASEPELEVDSDPDLLSSRDCLGSSSSSDDSGDGAPSLSERL